MAVNVLILIYSKSVFEISFPSGNCAAEVGNWHPTFQDSSMPLSSRVACSMKKKEQCL